MVCNGQYVDEVVLPELSCKEFDDSDQGSADKMRREH